MITSAFRQQQEFKRAGPVPCAGVVKLPPRALAVARSLAEARRAAEQPHAIRNHKHKHTLTLTNFMAAGPAGPARQRVPAFWGYSVAARAMGPAAALLEGARLPLVLDLDETLLAAFALGQLEARLETARAASRSAVEAAASAGAAQRCARPEMPDPACCAQGLAQAAQRLFS